MMVVEYPWQNNDVCKFKDKEGVLGKDSALLLDDGLHSVDVGGVSEGDGNCNGEGYC